MSELTRHPEREYFRPNFFVVASPGALDAYPALRAWLARIEATPGFVPMPVPDAQAQALIDQST